MTQSNEQRRRRLAQLPDKLHDYRHPADKPGRADSVRREEERQSLVEQRIQDAMAHGEFDYLPGAGKPFSFNQNPYLEPGQEWVFGLLQRNGLAPDWIERGKAIRREVDEARRQLAAAWRQFQADPDSAAHWQQATAQFLERLQKINHKIDDYNLVVPVVSAQQPRLSLDKELKRLQTLDAD